MPLGLIIVIVVYVGLIGFALGDIKSAAAINRATRFRSALVTHINVLEQKAAGVEHVAVTDIRAAVSYLRSKL